MKYLKIFFLKIIIVFCSHHTFAQSYVSHVAAFGDPLHCVAAPLLISNWQKSNHTFEQDPNAPLVVNGADFLEHQVNQGWLVPLRGLFGFSSSIIPTSPFLEDSNNQAFQEGYSSLSENLSGLQKGFYLAPVFLQIPRQMWDAYQFMTDVSFRNYVYFFANYEKTLQVLSNYTMSFGLLGQMLVEKIDLEAFSAWLRLKYAIGLAQRVDGLVPFSIAASKTASSILGSTANFGTAYLLFHNIYDAIYDLNVYLCGYSPSQSYREYLVSTATLSSVIPFVFYGKSDVNHSQGLFFKTMSLLSLYNALRESQDSSALAFLLTSSTMAAMLYLGNPYAFMVVPSYYAFGFIKSYFSF